MARTKYQKPRAGKQTKQNHNKKRGGGKENDVSELRAQLDVLGLKIIQVTADGNCFFRLCSCVGGTYRALADQLEGDEDEHAKYRHMIANFIKENREMFEPFVEDEPFDEYCRSMAEDATWAGNIELQAASLVTRSNICIHRHMSPRWYIQNFAKDEARMVHLSYHDGEHYNSVRTKEDTCSGPARSIIIKGEAEFPVKSRKEKAALTKNERGSGKNAVPSDFIEDGTGVKSMNEIEQQQGDAVDSATEDDISHSTRSSCDENQVEKSEQARLTDQDAACNGDSDNKKSFPSDEKKNTPRNKRCPCGSKTKYKSCCGRVTSTASARFPVQTVDPVKSHKDNKNCRKGGSTINHPDRGPLDMGALCL